MTVTKAASDVPAVSANAPAQSAPVILGHISNQMDHYLLGPGDTLSIKIADLEKFDQQFTVRPDGYASIQPFGEVYVSGTDIPNLQAWLDEKFKKYLLKPQITINVVDMRPAIVYITGAVQQPGSYQFVRQNLSNSGLNPAFDNVQMTLSNVLTHAGGVNIHADVHHVTVTHTATGEHETLDLTTLLTQEKSHDVWLSSGDKIYIPAMDHPMDPMTFALVSQSSFFKDKFPVVVLGAVEKQGEVQIDTKNNSLNAALALAGGFKQYLARTGTIVIQRPNDHGGFSRWAVDPHKHNLAMQPGDVVYVANSQLGNVQQLMQFISSLSLNYFYITGGASYIKSLQATTPGKAN